jgi:hypothetical protein
MNQHSKSKQSTTKTDTNRQPKHYERQINDDTQVDNPTQECVFSEPVPVPASGSLQSNRTRSAAVLNIVTHGQSKWRKQVSIIFSLKKYIYMFDSFSRYNNNDNQFIINMNYLISHSVDVIIVNRIKICT